MSTSLGHHTPVKLGLVIAICSAASGTMLAAVLFVNTRLTELSVKMDVLTQVVGQRTADSISLQQRQSEHEREDLKNWSTLSVKVDAIDKNGSEGLRSMEKRLNDVEQNVKVIMALRGQNLPQPSHN